MSRTKKKF